MKKYSTLLITGAVLVMSFVVSGSALASENDPFTSRNLTVYAGKGQLQKSVASGKVSLADGQTITIVDRAGNAHLLDISNARISKGFSVTAKNLASKDIKAGDKIFAFGSSSGLSVVTKPRV